MEVYEENRSCSAKSLTTTILLATQESKVQFVFTIENWFWLFYSSKFNDFMKSKINSCVADHMYIKLCRSNKNTYYENDLQKKKIKQIH